MAVKTKIVTPLETTRGTGRQYRHCPVKCYLANTEKLLYGMGLPSPEIARQFIDDLYHGGYGGS